MAAAVSACVTFLPYQTLTQSRGGFDRELSPIRTYVGVKERQFQKSSFGISTDEGQPETKGRLWFKCLSIYHNFVLVVTF